MLVDVEIVDAFGPKIPSLVKIIPACTRIPHGFAKLFLGHLPWLLDRRGGSRSLWSYNTRVGVYAGRGCHGRACGSGCLLGAGGDAFAPVQNCISSVRWNSGDIGPRLNLDGISTALNCLPSRWSHQLFRNEENSISAILHTLQRSDAKCFRFLWCQCNFHRHLLPCRPGRGGGGGLGFDVLSQHQDGNILVIHHSNLVAMNTYHFAGMRESGYLVRLGGDCVSNLDVPSLFPGRGGGGLLNRRSIKQPFVLKFLQLLPRGIVFPYASRIRQS